MEHPLATKLSGVDNLKFDISVIVLNYNPDFDKLCATLNSILSQKDVSFEIIIADDCSKITFEEQIKELFAKHNFTDYKLVLHKENVGTVQNLYDAVKASTGEYIKPISPADFLYNEETLKNVISYMKANNARVLFGDMVYYSKGEKTNVLNLKTPWCEQVYLSKNYNYKKVLKQQMIYYENISGAAVFYERNLMLEGLNFISNTVKFAEDAMLQYFATNEEKILYLPQFVIWYEYGLGISTNLEAGASPRLVKDFYNFYNLLKKKYPKNKIIKRNALLWNLTYKNKRFLKLFIKLFGFDYILFYIKRTSLKKKYKCSGYDIYYLEKWFNTTNN